MNRITVSGLARAIACRASCVLPQSFRSNREAQLGTAIHAYLEHNGDISKVPAEYHEECKRIDLDSMPIQGVQFAHEVAFAFSPITGACLELGRGTSRDYSLAPAGALCGTADAVGVNGRRAIVVDYKSGHADLGDIKENLQLGTYALMAARAYGCETASICIIHVRPDELPAGDWVELDSFELDSLEARLNVEWSSILAIGQTVGPDGPSPPPATEGEHCKYCPSFVHCPAKINLALALGAGDDQEFGDMAQQAALVLSQENAPEIYERLKMAEEVLDRVRHTLKDFAVSEPIRLPNGKVFGRREHIEHKIDPDAAMPTLTAVLGPEAQDEVVIKKSLSQESLKKLVRSRLNGRTMKAAYAEIWSELEKANAIRGIQSTRFGEFKLKTDSKGEQKDDLL